MSDCLFCQIIAGDVPCTHVYDDALCFAFEDINPGAPSHTLIVPRKHIASVHDVEPDDVEVMGNLYLAAQKVAKIKGLGDYRLVMNVGPGAGQSVFHIHLHVIGGRPLSWPPG